MASATGREGQAGGLGLRLELAQGPGGPQVRLHAGPAALAPGLRLVALVAEPLAAATPRSTEALRDGRWRALEARLEVTAEALEQAVQALRGARIGAWPIEQVAVDLAGEAAALTLTGPRDEGWPALAQIEVTAAAEAGCVAVRARRVWATGPLAPTAAGLWQAVTRRLAEGRVGAVTATPEGLRIAPEWLLRRAFRAAGARPPQTRGLRVRRVSGEGRGLRIALVHEDMSDGTCLDGRARELEGAAGSAAGTEPEDPLRPLRAALQAGAHEAALTALAQAPAPTHPGSRRMTGALAQVRAELLRFRDPAGAKAAVRAWLAASPDDPEAWWRLVVGHARAGEPEGALRGLVALERAPGPATARLRRRVARALVEAEQLGGGRGLAALEEVFGGDRPPGAGEARSARRAGRGDSPEGRGTRGVVEARSVREGEARGAEGGRRFLWAGLADLSAGASPEAQAEAWRALAIARAGDPEVPAEEVAATVSAALAAAARCPRRWCDDEELLARVAAAGRRCGRDVIEAEGAAAEISEGALSLARAGQLRRLAEEILRWTAGVDRRLLRAELNSRAARALEPGALLALARMVQETGESERARGLVQVAALLLPGVELDEALAWAASEEVAAGEERRAGSEVEAGDERAASEVGEVAALDDELGEPRAAIVAVLRELVAETGGIRASSELALAEAREAEQVLALVEPEVARLRAATGRGLPVWVAKGGPSGGVTIRNEREPALVVDPGLGGLPASERRFRLALAAALIDGGLAVALDPAGASMHELLAALAWLGEPSLPPTLPGAQTIVRVWQKRGVTPERFAPALRVRLSQQLERWRGERGRVRRLAWLLRGDHCVRAVRLAGAVDGALLALARDARLPEVVDEASARRACTTEEARRLLREVGLFAERGRRTPEEAGERRAVKRGQSDRRGRSRVRGGEGAR